MKVFLSKTVGVLIVIALIYSYQIQAQSLGQVREAAKIEEAKANEAMDIGYSDGIFTGIGMGFQDEIEISLTVNKGKIENIKVTKENDDKTYFESAASIIDDILAFQTTDGVDVVSGATFSSRGIIDAVDEALAKSRCN